MNEAWLVNINNMYYHCTNDGIEIAVLDDKGFRIAIQLQWIHEAVVTQEIYAWICKSMMYICVLI